MKRSVLLSWILLVWGCGSSPVSLETEILSQVLSIGNLNKLEVRDSGDANTIVGLNIQVDVINIGGVVINVPFFMTWRLRGEDGSVGSVCSMPTA